MTTVRQSSIRPGFTSRTGTTPRRPGPVPNPFALGQFSTPTNKLTSEVAQAEIKETLDSFTEDPKGQEEGDVVESGEIMETRVEGDFINELPKVPKEVHVTRKDSSAVPLSALMTARNIERLEDIMYPEGVKGPRKEFNKDVKDGRFRYDRDFLLQFMQLCKEKPPNLARLDILGIEPVDQATLDMTRGSVRHRQSSSVTTLAARLSSTGLGIAGSPSASPFAVDQFSSLTGKLTSEERHMLSTSMRSAASQGGPGGHTMGSNRIRSKRGDRRTDANKVTLSQQSDGPSFGGLGIAPILGTALEPVAPLEVSSNPWITSNTVRKPGVTGADLPELVVLKVSALLNELTTEEFDAVSDQIVSWVNKSENEKDAQTLRRVARLVYEKAIDEAARNELYAHLCRKMMEKTSHKVQDGGTTGPKGKLIGGGQLFRKYLIDHCREGYERGCVAEEVTAASEDQVIKAANKRKGDKSERYSDEYYTAQKAKDQGLGLIKFVGELFKLQMVTERIIHTYIKDLLVDVENPREDEIGRLCQLLITVGQRLDTPKARVHMDVYFAQMKGLCENPNVSPHLQFMLQEVIELRNRKWVVQGMAIAPTTISAVHEAAAMEKAATVAQTYERHLGTSRGGPRYGGDRESGPGADGLTPAEGSVTRPQPKAGDLSHFGKITKAAVDVEGSGTVFTKKDSKRDSLSRATLTPNTSSTLGQNSGILVDSTVKSSQPSGCEPSVDLVEGGALEPSKRKKLQLLSRKKRTGTPPQMSEADAKKKIDEDVKELFAVRSIDEAVVYFTNLPEEHRHHLVDKLVGSALESKEADAVLVSKSFARAALEGQCSLETFEAGFLPMAEFLDDIAIDAPNAYQFMAIMLKGAGLDKDEERLRRIANMSMNGDKLLNLVTVS